MFLSRSRSGWLALLLLAIWGPACNCGKTAPKVVQHPKDNGEACTADSDCLSNECAYAPGSLTKSCVQPCGTGCPAGQRCVQVSGSDKNPPYACAPDKATLCHTCTSDNDCSYTGDTCLPFGNIKACTYDCGGDGVCPQGYACTPTTSSAGKPVRECIPVSGTCECVEATRGQTRPCEHTNNFGTCTGVETCDPAKGFGGCDARVPAQEVCNGIDDDCNGHIDDGLGTSTCGYGPCQVTMDNCANGHTQICQPDLSQSKPETCNGRDDDCDGVIDNGFNVNTDANNCGFCGNVCPSENATPLCSSGHCTFTCLSGYQDCNHNPLDACEANLSNDPSNCGACGNICSFANASANCVSSGCVMGPCNNDYYNLDGDDRNGCEYHCIFQSPSDYPDLSDTDSNCDGIDGEVNNGVFVAPPPTGNDGNAGDMAHPFATINHAIQYAYNHSKRDVYVSAGTYLEQVTLLEGVGLYGGYQAAAAWSRSSANVVTLTGNVTPLVANNVHNGVIVQMITVVGSNASGSGQSAMAVQLFSSDVTFAAVQVYAGDGAGGSDGFNGSRGADGSPGFNGDTGVEDSDFLCDSCNGCHPQGGAGGTNNQCSAANAGKGGAAGHDSQYGNNGANSAQNATGGAGRQCCQGNSTAPSSNNGQDGWTPGIVIDGAGGPDVGTFSASNYTPADGADGNDGADGVGGGGGGGGGGGTSDCDSWGSGGGGGGAGGCGGTHGTHGAGGGASVAIFLSGGSLTVDSCTFVSGNGGPGGQGGQGGDPGNGAAPGISPYGSSASQDDGSLGGRGGYGADGARGGHGGGGGGGPSLGVVSVSGGRYLPDSATFVGYGSGGAGGTMPFGNPGHTGLAQATYP
jgi:hypothetical protein